MQPIKYFLVCVLFGEVIVGLLKRILDSPSLPFRQHRPRLIFPEMIAIPPLRLPVYVSGMAKVIQELSASLKGSRRELPTLPIFSHLTASVRIGITG